MTGWSNGMVSVLRKKRSLKQLSKQERIEIADAYTKHFEHRKDIAARYRVSEQVVSRLVALSPCNEKYQLEQDVN